MAAVVPAAAVTRPFFPPQFVGATGVPVAFSAPGIIKQSYPPVFIPSVPYPQHEASAMSPFVPLLLRETSVTAAAE